MKKKSNTNNENAFTTIKTSYARAAVVLLALNFCLVGYVIVNMSKATQEILDVQDGSSPTTTEKLAKEN